MAHFKIELYKGHGVSEQGRCLLLAAQKHDPIVAMADLAPEALLYITLKFTDCAAREELRPSVPQVLLSTFQHRVFNPKVKLDVSYLESVSIFIYKDFFLVLPHLGVCWGWSTSLLVTKNNERKGTNALRLK